MEKDRVFPTEVASGVLGGTFIGSQGFAESVREIMTQEVPSVGPDFDAGTIADLLVANDVGGLPVVRGGRLIGFVTLAEATREALECVESTTQGSIRLSGRRGVTYRAGAGFHAVSSPARAVDIMLPASVALTPGTSIAAAAAKLANHRLTALPVAEEDGRLAGVVTALDILRWLARQHGLPVRNGLATRLEAV